MDAPGAELPGAAQDDQVPGGGDPPEPLAVGGRHLVGEEVVLGGVGEEPGVEAERVAGHRVAGRRPRRGRCRPEERGRSRDRRPRRQPGRGGSGHVGENTATPGQALGEPRRRALRCGAARSHGSRGHGFDGAGVAAQSAPGRRLLSRGRRRDVPQIGAALDHAPRVRAQGHRAQVDEVAGGLVQPLGAEARGPGPRRCRGPRRLRVRRRCAAATASSGTLAALLDQGHVGGRDAHPLGQVPASEAELEAAIADAIVDLQDCGAWSSGRPEFTRQFSGQASRNCLSRS